MFCRRISRGWVGSIAEIKQAVLDWKLEQTLSRRRAKVRDPSYDLALADGTF